MTGESNVKRKKKDTKCFLIDWLLRVRYEGSHIFSALNWRDQKNYDTLDRNQES